jgi:hypothetical protein
VHPATLNGSSLQFRFGHSQSVAFHTGETALGAGENLIDAWYCMGFAAREEGRSVDAVRALPKVRGLDLERPRLP